MADQQYVFMSKSVSIANGATVSSSIDLQGLGLLQIMMPAAFTGTTITFQSSLDDVTYQACYNTAGSALSCTVAASRNILMSPGDLVGIRFLKLVSGSAEGGARTINLQVRELK